jgi:hypothetical protein
VAYEGSTVWERDADGILTDSIPLCCRINYVLAYVRLTQHTCIYRVAQKMYTHFDMKNIKECIHFFGPLCILILYKATCFDFQEVIVRPFSERKN